MRRRQGALEKLARERVAVDIAAHKLRIRTDAGQTEPFVKRPLRIHKLADAAGNQPGEKTGQRVFVAAVSFPHYAPRQRPGVE